MSTNLPATVTNKLPKALLDLGKPSLGNLSYALRHPDTWPEGFVWDYGHCDNCAMGLAHALWSSIPRISLTNGVDGASKMARIFAMPYETADSIFMGQDPLPGREGSWVPRTRFTRGHLWWKEPMLRHNFAAVTPEMVANQIDRYLATAE